MPKIGYKQTEGHRRKIGLANKDKKIKPCSEERRTKLKLIMKDKTWEELYGKEKTKKMKEKMNLVLKGRKRKPFTKETKKKMSLKSLERFKRTK